jgi:hypothetical protein
MSWLQAIWQFWISDSHFWFSERVLRPLTVYLAMPTAVFGIMTWWAVTFGRKWRHRRWHRRSLAAASRRLAAVLILDFTKSSIDTQVLTFLKTVPMLTEFPRERVFKISRIKDILPTDIPDLVAALRTTVDDMMHAGINDVHLFYGGPVGFATVVGAELKNFFNVTVYQRSNLTGSYESWGPLRHPVT